MRISLAFEKIAQLAIKRGGITTDIVQMEVGPYIIRVNRTGKELDVPPYSACVTYNGWPFAALSPFEGVIGDGEIANEDHFIAALDKALGSQPELKGV